MNISDWIAFSSIIIAALSFILAIKSFFISKNTFNLMLNQDKRQLPKLRLYLQESFALPIEKENFTIYAFLLTVSNATYIDNSIKEIVLKLSYKKTQNIYNYISAHNSDVSVFCNNISPFNIPTKIPAHDNVVGWALFKIDNTLLKESFIDSYLLSVKDTHDLSFDIEPIIVNEVTSYAKLEENKDFIC